MYWYESRARTNLGGPDSVPAGCAVSLLNKINPRVLKEVALQDQAMPDDTGEKNIGTDTNTPELTSEVRHCKVPGVTSVDRIN